MSKGPYAHLDKGTFLIASPDIELGYFSRSVLLLCDHSHQGSFALLINKAMDVELPEEVFPTALQLNPHITFCTGGPLQPNQMMILHDKEPGIEQSLALIPGVSLGGDLKFLQEAMQDRNGPQLKLCLGYIAWPHELLEKEFLASQWFLHPASAQHIFETPMDKLWQTLLLEMGGKYASLSMIPEDPSLN